MINAPRQRVGGFTLMEIMTVISLYGVFMLMASQLFVTNTHLLRGAHEAQDAILRFERIVEQMRRDVWSATDLQIQDEHTLILRATGQPAVTWRMVTDEQTLLRDSQSKGLYRYRYLGAVVSFARDGEAVLVTVDDGTDTSSNQLRLISQMIQSRSHTP